ncbi:MAG: UDP-N-acetylmuramoyl-tripeptide--D-alanyl-D-alanine ligase [Candidatus Omnitrophota bacterium]|jgi:UDP-N-acetylmuramoyl-tripeptide--D-alanyl-D-alanine ligase|nr:MAG: UDP-N-acetylmuramoyl-tripeptide--D-alanyl-D-alanine ligase [Candidatus Omnitrophota bacterium]
MFTLEEILKATGGTLFEKPKKFLAGAISIDSRALVKGDVFIAIKGERFDGHDFIEQAARKGASLVIIDKKRGQTSPYKRSLAKTAKTAGVLEVKDPVASLADLARFQRTKYPVPVIAVTGSNGKTTTKEMISHLLSSGHRVLKNEGTKNNNIGLPLTLLKLDASFDSAVVEIGTNHPGEVRQLAEICLPNIGVITNIGPAHLEYFDTLQGVCKEKFSLIRSLTHPRIAILNRDDVWLKKRLCRASRNFFAVSYGVRNASDFSCSRVALKGGSFSFLVNGKYKFTLPTMGYYNIYNALAAVAVARMFGIGYKTILSRIADFRFPAGRLAMRKIGGIRFIDDTYNANPLSFNEALRVLAATRVKGRKICVMGDMFELGRHSRAFHSRAGEAASAACDVLVAVGSLCRHAAEAAAGRGLDKQQVFTCADSIRAKEILRNKIKPGKDDIVLVKGSRMMKMENVF